MLPLGLSATKWLQAQWLQLWHHMHSLCFMMLHCLTDVNYIYYNAVITVKTCKVKTKSRKPRYVLRYKVWPASLPCITVNTQYTVNMVSVRYFSNSGYCNSWFLVFTQSHRVYQAHFKVLKCFQLMLGISKNSQICMHLFLCAFIPPQTRE